MKSLPNFNISGGPLDELTSILNRKVFFGYYNKLAAVFPNAENFSPVVSSSSQIVSFTLPQLIQVLSLPKEQIQDLIIISSNIPVQEDSFTVLNNKFTITLSPSSYFSSGLQMKPTQQSQGNKRFTPQFYQKTYELPLVASDRLLKFAENYNKDIPAYATNLNSIVLPSTVESNTQTKEVDLGFCKLPKISNDEEDLEVVMNYFAYASLNGSQVRQLNHTDPYLSRFAFELSDTSQHLKTLSIENNVLDKSVFESFLSQFKNGSLEWYALLFWGSENMVIYIDTVNKSYILWQL